MTAILAHELAPGHRTLDAQTGRARGAQSPDRAMPVATPKLDAPGRGATSPAATEPTSPIAAAPQGIQTDDGAGAEERSTPNACAPRPVVTLFDPTLALAADVLDDLERVKISNEGRLRQLTRSVEDSDGEMRGFGLDESHPDVARLASLVQALEEAEHQAVLNLQRAMRRHPLGPWVKARRGVGEKQVARLLAAIGDPAVNSSTGEFRTVSALWAYSGLHVVSSSPAGQRRSDAQCPLAGGGSISAGGDSGQGWLDTQGPRAGVAPRRSKGQRANWSTHAKTRAWLIVQSCLKQIDPACKTDTGVADHVDGCACSPYRIVVDERRKHTAVTRPGWTPGHSLNDAMRVASKRLLRDLWREARRLHEVAS